MATPEDVLHALGKTYSAEILEATAAEMSAQELSDALDVPIATCYRRINELDDAGLISLSDRPLSNDGKRVGVYRRTIDEIRVDFERDLSVELEPRSDVKNKLDEVWRALDD